MANAEDCVKHSQLNPNVSTQGIHSLQISAELKFEYFPMNI